MEVEKHLINYYLENLEKNGLIKGCQGYGIESGELEYIITILTNKGKVALDNPNNLIQETNMGEHRTINTNNYSENIGIRNMNGCEINEGAKIGGIINEAESKNLAIAVKEVQEILEQLSNTHPIQKTTDKMIVAGKAIEKIEQNPQLTQTLLSAAKAGSLAAIESMLNHPLASFIIAAIEDLKNHQ